MIMIQGLMHLGCQSVWKTRASRYKEMLKALLLILSIKRLLATMAL